jgi:hypothetical protein
MADSPNLARILLSELVGLPCTEVKKPSDWFWQFVFGQAEAVIGVEGFWRVIVDGKIDFARDDDGQKFGLPEPVNGVNRCTELLQDNKVISFELRLDVSDLFVTFENGARLEIFNTSAGYESWSYQARSGKMIHALGGGDVAIFGPA